MWVPQEKRQPPQRGGLFFYLRGKREGGRVAFPLAMGGTTVPTGELEGVRRTPRDFNIRVLESPAPGADRGEKLSGGHFFRAWESPLMSGRISGAGRETDIPTGHFCCCAISLKKQRTWYFPAFCIRKNQLILWKIFGKNVLIFDVGCCMIKSQRMGNHGGNSGKKASKMVKSQIISNHTFIIL